MVSLVQETSSSFEGKVSYGDGAIALSEIISALTFALDMTEGALPGHALRSCVLGMRIARAFGLPDHVCSELYYALLLKDVGCSSNAARLCAIISGDEVAMKAGSKVGDWKSFRMMKVLWNNVTPDGNAWERMVRIAKMGRDREKNNTELYSLRCNRGANIVRKLEMGENAADAVYHLDEFWDGSGYPFHLKGEEIPLFSRICSIAQNLDVFAAEFGTGTAIEVMRQRSGTWFDPTLVNLVQSLHKNKSLWKHCGPYDNVETTRALVMDLDDSSHTPLTSQRLDGICEAFSSVVDAKSPFTYRHSIGVAETATALAKELKLSPERSHMIRRAALLHDIGKLRVPNSILDKNGKPTDDEWKIIREHPCATRNVLRRVGAFRELSVIAAEHHERLDGTGYPFGLCGKHMSLESRLIATADVYSALAEERPYRGALDPKVVLGIIGGDVPKKLDAVCFDAMTAIVERGDWNLSQVVSRSLEQGAYSVGENSTCEIIPIRESPGIEQAVAI